MSKINDLLQDRLKTNKGSTSKMAAMAKMAADGNRSSFAGMFSVSELSAHEKLFLEDLLNQFANEESLPKQDLQSLISITAEVKAINNQAALLHGERIKKAQEILTQYRDGAFTAWLIAAYGNRQTPYNFLQYYEFSESLNKEMRLRIEQMPRQAIYTLASREGPLNKKIKMIENYRGETKAELLRLIREQFPLHEKDRRRKDVGEQLIQSLTRISLLLNGTRSPISKQQKNAMRQLLDHLYNILEAK